MAQSNDVKSLSLFLAFEQIKTTLEAIEIAEESGHGQMIDAYIGDIYAILKDSEGGVDRSVGFIRYCEKEIDLIDEEIKRLREIKASKQRKIERIKQLALALMDTLGIKSLDGAHGRKIYKVQTSSVNIFALDQIPDSLKRVTTVIEPNKKAIADYILETGHCAGATLAINSYVKVR